VTSIVVAFGVAVAAVLVHEAGHAIAARACGLTVHVLSLGVGPTLWTRRHGATTLRIGAIPFGGYVRYAEGAADQARRGARALVVLAGPLANVGLAVLLLGLDSAHLGPRAAIARVLGATASVVGNVAHALVALPTGAAPPDGPVAVARLADASLTYGLPGIARLAAVLSLNVAVLNLLPIPVLDGGRLVVLGIEAWRGRPLERRALTALGLAGLLLLAALVLLVLVRERRRPDTPRSLGEVRHHLVGERPDRLHRDLVRHGAHLHDEDQLVDAGGLEARHGLARRHRVTDHHRVLGLGVVAEGDRGVELVGGEEVARHVEGAERTLLGEVVA
jgi:regulator of sigma E protease